MGGSVSLPCKEIQFSDRAAPITLNTNRYFNKSSDFEAVMSPIACAVLASSVASTLGVVKRSDPQEEACYEVSTGNAVQGTLVTDVEIELKDHFLFVALMAGMEMKIFVDGLGDMPIQASLDKGLSRLTLEYKTARKDFWLKQVRQVGIRKVEGNSQVNDSDVRALFDDGTFTGSCRKRSPADKAYWIAQVKLYDDQFICFSFEGNQRGMSEAQEFSDFLRSLVDVARFEQARMDLQELAKQEEVARLKRARLALESFIKPRQDARARCAHGDPPIAVSRQTGINGTGLAVHPVFSEVPSTPRKLGNVLDDGANREHLIARLKAVGANMGENGLP